MTNALTIPDAPPSYSYLVQIVCENLPSPRSAQAYARDLEDWAEWCSYNRALPSAPYYDVVRAYLHDLAERGLSRATLQRRLSVLRKLARVASILGDEGARKRAESLSLLQVQVDTTQQPVYERRALTPDEVGRALAAWSEATNQAKRNRALLAVGFCTGARRSEIATLRWDDIDLEAGVMFIRHGKGDKERHASIYGEFALRALRAWKRALADDARVFVFPRVYKNDRVGSDEPLSADGVYYVIRETCKRTGEPFSPHDMRRTLITEALATGTPLADVQAQAGHAAGSTTLGYAQASDAEKRREKGKLRYG